MSKTAYISKIKLAKGPYSHNKCFSHLKNSQMTVPTFLSVCLKFESFEANHPPQHWLILNFEGKYIFLAYLVDVLKKLDSRFINSERNLVISSSILRISASKRSRMLLNSLSMTLKSPNLMGMLCLRPLSDICTVHSTSNKNKNVEKLAKSAKKLKELRKRELKKLETLRNRQKKMEARSYRRLRSHGICK